MTREESINYLYSSGFSEEQVKTIAKAFEPIPKNDSGVDCIDRQATLDTIIKRLGIKNESYLLPAERTIYQQIKEMPSVTPQEPKTGQYEKHTDHTDCIWYGSDSGCPVTCSQYRDGWNDAMDYIFKNGKGYQPYRHDG